MIRRGRHALGAVLCGCAFMSSGWPALAGSPDWAKPYIKRPVPTGSYIAKNDEFVALYSEVSVGVAPSGGLTRTYRQVLAPVGSKGRRLSLTMDYNEAVESLVEPKVWAPGAITGVYREVNLKRAGVDAPHLEGGFVTSNRHLFVSTTMIEPDERAIATWQVVDSDPFPGEDLLYPFGPYPVAEFVLRREPPAGGRTAEVRFLEPAATASPAIREDDLVLRDLPAIERIYEESDLWLAVPTQALPLGFARAAGNGAPSWESRAVAVAAIFQKALAPEGFGALKSTTKEIIAGAATPAAKIARLAAFVQSLSYRNILWGEGRYVPESPSESLRTRSADCKGKVVLLKALLSEIGVASVPVMCTLEERYVDAPRVPMVLGFNHVILAIAQPAGDAQPTGGALPATLSDGPGRGYILFDPTDPLAVLGEPPSKLEGTAALWLDAGAPGLFSVHTREPGGYTATSRLSVALEGAEASTFTLVLEGSTELLGNLAQAGSSTRDAKEFRDRCQEHFQTAAPGLQLTGARFVPPDHVARRPARLELEGRIPMPLAAVGGGLFTWASPTLLTGLALEVPRYGFQRKAPAEADRAVAPAAYAPDPCCQGFNSRIRGEIAVTLPEGWSVRACPKLAAMDTPWVKAQADCGPPWTMTLDLPRGRFPAGSDVQRLKDVNGAVGVLRQPFLLQNKPPGS